MLKSLCDRQAAGTDYRIRRTLMPGTLEVGLMRGYGAVATGLHRFYKRADGKPDEVTGIARFVVLWKREFGAWRMARVISYDHREAR
ncbi:MAG: nuclear transport factor 2 family protein [Gemmatimonadaceae bacterium]|nr:nuclear transport factor 2 family protein [Gemmatimonadaceae bacterium]